MSRAKNKQEVNGEVAVLDQPLKEEAAQVATSTKVVYWSPENERLKIASNGGTVCFENFSITLNESDARVKVLEKSATMNQSFFRVINRSGDDEYKEAFMRYLRKTIESDPADQVGKERGIMALMALFSPDELASLEISRSMINVERLLLAAINNKYVEGIV